MATSSKAKTSEKDPCWKGYEQVGMKDKDGKQVPNCVPEAKATDKTTAKKKS